MNYKNKKLLNKNGKNILYIHKNAFSNAFLRYLIIILFIFLTNGIIYGADCNIDWGITYQTISGFGGSSAWSEWSGCPCGTNTFLVNNIQQFFSETNGIGLTIIRARIPPDQGQWASTFAPLQAASNLGALVMATVWTPPAAWKSNGRVDNSDGGYLLPEYYDEYADYLVNYINTLKSYNVNLYAISPANEPDYQVSYDGCSWTGAQLRDFIKNYLGPAFAANNITTKILVPESFRNDCTYADTILSDALARNYVFAIAQHIYGAGPVYCTAAGTYNKEFWQTERSSFESYDATMTHGITTAIWIHNSFVNANYNAFLYWWLAADQANEGLRGVNYGIPKRFWVMGNFSKFIRPGFKRISCSSNPVSGVYASAYKNSLTGEFAIVVINTNSSSVSNQRFNLNAMSVSSVTPYLTDESNDLTQQSAVLVTGNSFTYNLPAKSVITFKGVSANVTVSPTNTFTITHTPTPVTSVLLDDFEDCNGINNWDGSWYTYKDNNSTLLPFPFSTTSGGVSGSTICSVQMTGNIVSGGYGGVGTNLNSGGTAVDLTLYSGIEFYVKGDGGTYWLQFTQPSISNGDYFGVNFTAPANWTKVQVFFETSGLHQRGWGAPATFTQNEIIAIQWTNYTSGAINFQIDDVKLIVSLANTMTPTYTNTYTPTITMSATSTNTRTFTHTLTNTMTETQSPTFTSTITNTLTTTNTFTVTGTPTKTMTYTETVTGTQTQTLTDTGTPTKTLTFTATDTFTTTYTQTQTNTITMTNSETETVIMTGTFTFTETATNTFTFSYTQTPTETSTFTEIITGTQLATLTNTNTQIPTGTFTFTVSHTNTQTSTITLTGTVIYTNTATKTITVTMTHTFTHTYTQTATITLTVTLTPVLATPSMTESEKLEFIKEKRIIIYPNPSTGLSDIYIKFYITKKADFLNMRIYTTGLRLIREKVYEKVLLQGENEIKIPKNDLKGLSRGIYYFVIFVKDKSGQEVKSKLEKMVIIY